MDLPAIVTEYFPQVDMEFLSEAMEEYEPAWEILKHTWNNETMKEIMQGKLTVPDEVINKAIAENLAKWSQQEPEDTEGAEAAADSRQEADDGENGDAAAEALPEASGGESVQETADKETDGQGQTAAEQGDTKAKESSKTAEQVLAAAKKQPPIKELKITSKKNGRLEIYADTEKLGRVEFSGTIEEFVHNTQDSHVTYKVKERALKDHGLASWFFSRISLSMAQNLFGKVDFGDMLPTKISGNTITVDCKNALEQSDLAQAEIKGYRVLDMIEIKNAVPLDGYIEFETQLNIPEEIQIMVLDILLRPGGTNTSEEQ